MTRRSRLLESIAGTIADYRAGEISLPTSAHVERWIEQFDGAAQEPILAELDHILDHTYIPKKEVQRFLVSLLKNKELAGADLCSFWANVEFLDIQGGGNSQREMLGMFDEGVWISLGLRTERHDFLTITAREVCPEPRQSIALVEGA